MATPTGSTSDRGTTLRRRARRAISRLRASRGSGDRTELDYEPTVADRRAAQRKLLLEANRGPPSLVDVSRAVTVGLERRRGDSGLACASVSSAAVAAPGPRPGPLPRGIAMALPRLPRLAQKFIFPADLPLQRLDSAVIKRAKSADRARHCRGPIVAAGGPEKPADDGLELDSRAGLAQFGVEIGRPTGHHRRRGEQRNREPPPQRLPVSVCQAVSRGPC